jgi:hypothetical protein
MSDQQPMTIPTPAEAAEIEQILAWLGQTPRHIAELVQERPSERLQARPDPDTWSANDILAHLRACADVWGKSILAMIAQDHPTLRYVSPRTWMKKTTYATLDFRASLQAFAEQRAELMKVLSHLDAAGWSRGATFTGTTRGREATVMNYARRIADHEREHCEQLEAMLEA